MPFGEYKDFADCVSKNSDKENSQGYCADIHKKITGKWPNEKSENNSIQTKLIPFTIKYNTYDNPEKWVEIKVFAMNQKHAKDIILSKNKKAQNFKVVNGENMSKLDKLYSEIVTPIPEEQADPKELEMGIKVELEHTDNPEEAKKIALQHLAEVPDYYTKLKKVESMNKIESLHKKVCREGFKKIELKFDEANKYYWIIPQNTIDSLVIERALKNSKFKDDFFIVLSGIKQFRFDDKNKRNEAANFLITKHIANFITESINKIESLHKKVCREGLSKGDIVNWKGKKMKVVMAPYKGDNGEMKIQLVAPSGDITVKSVLLKDIKESLHKKVCKEEGVDRLVKSAAIDAVRPSLLKLNGTYSAIMVKLQYVTQTPMGLEAEFYISEERDADIKSFYQRYLKNKLPKKIEFKYNNNIHKIDIKTDRIYSSRKQFKLYMDVY